MFFPARLGGIVVMVAMLLSPAAMADCGAGAEAGNCAARKWQGPSFAFSIGKTWHSADLQYTGADGLMATILPGTQGLSGQQPLPAPSADDQSLSFGIGCKRRSNNPSVKRPNRSVAPE